MVLLFLIILLGASIGSFLTVVIFRTSTQETIIFRHSRCSHCRHKLHPHDLIPIISYLLRGGKCAYCKTRISWLYPLVELSTTLAFVLAYFLSDFMFKDIATQSILFFCLALLFSVLLVIFFRYLNKIDFFPNVPAGDVIASAARQSIRNNRKRWIASSTRNDDDVGFEKALIKGCDE